MSWNYDKACRSCGLIYKHMRTGFTYSDIYMMLWDEYADRAKWRYKRRGTVLGKWHQIKKEMWSEHVEACAQEKLAGYFSSAQLHQESTHG